MLSNLKKHVITVHEKKKMAKCDICNKAFSTKGNRDSHIKKKHSGDPDKQMDKTHFCKLCQKVVPYGHKAEAHKPDANGNFDCPKCGKHFDYPQLSLPSCKAFRSKISPSQKENHYSGCNSVLCKSLGSSSSKVNSVV